MNIIYVKNQSLLLEEQDEILIMELSLAFLTDRHSQCFGSGSHGCECNCHHGRIFVVGTRSKFEKEP
jgi:hypothetical protein